MNSRRNTTRRLEKEIANARVLPCGDEVPPRGEEVNDDQVPVDPPPLMYGAIMAALLQMAQAIPT